MLSVHLESLPESEQHKIRQWLLKPERLALESCVRAELAEKEAEISAAVLDKYLNVLETKNIPNKAGDAMMAAALLRNFLQILDELGKENRVFRKATATIT